MGDWLVVPKGNRLHGPAGDVVRLEPKVMQVLECLAAHPGRTVTKEDFMDRVWAGTVVSDDVLARCISELRKAFGDNPRKPDYIETIRKSGYRLIAPVSTPAAPRPEPPAEVPPSAAGQPIENEAAALAAAPDVPVDAVSVEASPGSDGASLPVMAPPGPPRWKEAMWWAAGASTVLLVGLIVGFAFFQGRDDAPLKTVPFTSFPGQEADPELSPDGEKVAFTWEGADGGNVDVYVKQAGAEIPLRLTDNPAREHSPAWSPDGLNIAFVRATDEGVREVVIVPAIGGTERVVATFEDREVSSLVWSSDGTTLALSAQAEPTGPYSLFLLSVETLDVRQLTEAAPAQWGDAEPAFSPNSERLAFVRRASEGVEDLFVVSARGGEPERLTRDEREIAGLDWASDGQSIVFASSRAEGAGLWRIPAAGGTPERIATSGEGESVRQPSVARRARRLTYEQRSSDANIWAIRQGRFGRLPLIHSTRWESNPQFSPDGTQIAFASDRSGSPEVWVVDADGENPIQLTDFAGPLVTLPRWAPDGRRLAFDARVEGNADIYIIDAAGGQPRRLTDDPASDVAPSWSVDSTVVYFSSDRSGEWEVWLVAAEGGRPSRVTYNGGYNAFQAPDGEQLYYAKKGEPGLWRHGFTDEQETLVLGALEPFDWGNWAVTDDGIYFIRREDDGPTIRFYSFLSGWSTRVATLDDVPEQPSLAVSPDGRVLLYTHVDRNESDILLVEDFQ
ncbi:MAG: winged helix-turn-helix domain-containing protein [Bacteroidota bacterium]